MIRRLLPWLAPLAVMALWAAWAFAAPAAAPQAGDEETGGVPQKVPVLGYFLAFIFTVATLVIVCMPSRKQS